MSNKITIEFLRRRFERVICPAMGWVYSETLQPSISHVFIEKAQAANRWRVVMRPKGTSGERNISDNLTKSELLAFTDGLLYAAEIFNGDRGNG